MIEVPFGPLLTVSNEKWKDTCPLAEMGRLDPNGPGIENRGCAIQRRPRLLFFFSPSIGRTLTLQRSACSSSISSALRRRAEQWPRSEERRVGKIATISEL